VSISGVGRPKGYAQDALLAAVARSSPLAVQLIATPFVIASVGVNGFAVWALLTTTINLILTADLGVVGIMQRYHGLARGRGDAAMGGRITATVLAVLVVLYVVVTLLGPTIADAALSVIQVAPGVRDEAWQLFRHAGSLAVLQLVGLTFGSYLAAHSRFAATATVSVLARLFGSGAIAVALITGQGLSGLLIAAYVDAIAAIVLGVLFCIKHLALEVRSLVRRDEVGELWSYAWRNQASAIGFVAQRESDVIMAAILLPAAFQATIASSAQLAAAVALAPVVFLVPLFTRLSTLVGSSRKKAIEETHGAESNWFSVIIPFGAVVLAVGPFLATVWLGPLVSDVPVIMAVLSLGFLIVLANSVRAILVRAIGRPGLETMSYVALLVVKVAVGIPATLLFGVYGLAASTVVASLAAVAVMWFITRERTLGLVPGRVRVRPVAAAVVVLACGTPLALVVMHFIDTRWLQIALLVVLAVSLAGLAAAIVLGRTKSGP
jgi:O-antigen/teichoic acid export membrane protein